MPYIVAREMSWKGRVHICFGYGEAFTASLLPSSKALQASRWPRGADQLHLPVCGFSRLQLSHCRSSTSKMAIERFNGGAESDFES